MKKSLLFLVLISLIFNGNVFANAIQLNGSDAYIYLGDASVTAFQPGNNFTIEFWLKPSGDGTVLSIGEDGQPGSYHLGLQSGTLYASYFGESSSSQGLWSGNPQNNSWNHIAVVFGSNQVTVWLNGSNTQTISTARAAIPAGASIISGAVRQNGNPSDFLSGSISSVRIWSKALISSEIQFSHQSYMLFSEADLIHSWSFEDGTGNTVPDQIGTRTALLEGGYQRIFEAPVRYTQGSGLEFDPYHITTADHLYGMRYHPDASFILQNSVDLSEASWTEGSGWLPVGSTANPFTGRLNGNNHSISGLTINRPGEQGVGLFGYMEGATISNLTLTDISVTGGQHTAGLVAIAEDTEITNIRVTGILNGTNYIGGIVAELSGNTSILDRVMANVEITGNRRAGAVAGQLNEGEINRATASGSVTTTDDMTGGLLGVLSGGTLRNSYSVAEVQSLYQVGGLAGRNEGAGSLIQSSYAAGRVHPGEGNVNAIVGFNVGSGLNLENVYWDTESTTRPSNPSGGTGLSRLQMMDNNSFSGFSFFSNIWVQNSGYPFIQDFPLEPSAVLISPADEARLGSTTVDFAWAGSPSDITSYEFQLATNIEFDSPISNQNIFGATTTRSGLEVNTLYYWRVRAQSNASGFGEWTESRSFAIPEFPGMVSLNSPSQSSINQPVQTAFSWGSANEAESYILLISENADMSNPAREISGITGTSHTLTSEEALLPNQQYYWTVRGFNEIGGVGPTSSVLNFQTVFFIGSGDIDDPYLISTLEQLNLIRNSSGSTTSFRLTNDIDLTEATSDPNGSLWNNGTGWTPIPNFAGILDGDGFAIVGLHININGALSNVGFFENSFGTVRNIEFREASIHASDATNVGILAGSISGGLYENIRLDGSVVGSANVGAAFGNASNYNISDFTTDVEVTATENAGGVFGVMGLSSFPATRLESRGSVTATTSGAGGIAGRVQGGEIRNSYSFARIETPAFGGSLAGEITSGLIQLSYGAGEVVGSGATIRAVAGAVNNANFIQNVYWDIERTGQSQDSGNGTGLSNSQMALQSSYGGFDFSGGGSWRISDGMGYPYLSGRPAPSAVELISVIDQQEWVVRRPELSWRGSATEIASYTLQIDTDAGMHAAVEISNLNTVAYTFAEDLDLRETYYWRVGLVDPNGSTEWSQVYSFRVQMMDGDGSPGNPWLVNDPVALHHVREFPNAHFRQIASIDMAEATGTASGLYWDSGAGWMPIGTESDPFSGEYDGDGFTISGLFMNRPDTEYAGLFGVVSGWVSNLNLTEADISANRFVGGITGLLTGEDAQLSNIHVSGEITAINTAQEGIQIGGLAGRVHQGEILRSGADVVIRGKRQAGGIAGRVENGGRITESWSTGQILITDDFAGGLAGVLDNAEISDSYSLVSISTPFQVGSLLGNAANGAVINRSYGAGNISSTWGSARGLIGTVTGTVSVNNSYWNTETTGKTESPGGGTGLTTIQMMQQGSFSNWDFGNVWAIRSGADASYPYLPNNEPETLPGFIAVPLDVTLLSPVNNLSNAVIAPTFSWSTAFLAYSYQLQIAETSDFSGEFHTDILLESTSLTLTEPLLFGTTYYWRVRGVNTMADPVVNGNWSNTFTLSTSMFEGDGTEGSPWQVTTIGQLQQMSTIPNGHFRIMNPIDASETETWNDGLGFEPVGTSGTPFSGILDGQGHSISGLYIHRPTAQYVGLFGVLSSASISNLNLTDVSITGNRDVGGVAGEVTSGTTLQDIRVSGQIAGEDDGATASERVGGIIGSAGNSTLSRAYFNGQVHGSGTAGLIAGAVLQNSSLDRAVSEGEMVLSTGSGGGIAGLLSESNISNAYSIARMESTAPFGGLVGEMHSGDLETSYFAGEIGGAPSVGNPVVGTYQAGTITDVYWNTISTGIGSGVHGAPLSNQEMYAAGSFDSFDFTNTWLSPDGHFPYLIGVTPVIIPGFFDQIEDPVVLSPADADRLVPVQPTFTWKPPRAAEYTHIQIARDAAFTDIVAEEPQLTGLSYSMSFALDAFSEYYWRVRSSNTLTTQTLQSDWSEGAIIHTQGSFSGGSGTAGSPFIISHIDQLDMVRLNLSAHYRLNQHLDATSTQDWYQGAGFQPIGESPDEPFAGTLDGQGHSVTGLFIDRSESDYIGLFGVTNGDIRNLTLIEADITGNRYVGGIAGAMDHVDALIQNVRVSGSVAGVSGTHDATHIGGIAGWVAGGGHISRSQSDASISGASYGGGIVGLASANGQITESRAGGVIEMTDAYAGGIAGRVNGAQIADAYATADITTPQYAGGVIGFADNGTEVSRVYGVGEINASPASSGGLIGQTGGSVSVLNSYWNTETTGMSVSSGGGIGLSTLEMYNRSNYSGWDFNTIWTRRTGNGISFPVLRNATEVPEPGLIETLPVPELLYPVQASVVSDQTLPFSWSEEDVVNLYRFQLSSDINFSALIADEQLSVFSIPFPEELAEGSFYWRVRTELITGEGILASTWSQVSVFSTFMPYASGSGTAESPFVIATLDQLQAVSIFRSSHFVLEGDIDATETETWNEGAGFQPIGNPDQPFAGKFDGNGYAISNLYINRPGEEYAGLFGTVTGEIANIRLTDVDIVANRFIGGVTGLIMGEDSRITNAHVSGTLTGINGGQEAIQIGGIAGRLQNGEISRSSAEVALFGRRQGGGIVGRVESGGTVTQSWASGTSSITDDLSGGLVGVLNNGTIQDSYSLVDISTLYQVGGLVGNAGNNSIILRSYAVGALVSTQGSVGGLVGTQSGSLSVQQSFWNTQTTGRASSVGGGTGIGTSQMYSKAIFEAQNWDFEEIWAFTEGEATSFPYLIHNIQTPAPGFLNEIQAPNLDSPAHQSLEVSRTPTLVWNQVVSGYEYELELSTNPEFSDASVYSSSTQTSIQLPLLDRNQLYYWRVRSMLSLDSSTLISEWSSPFEFTTGDPFPLGEGTEQDPFIILSVEQLQLIQEYPDLHYALNSDIDASSTISWNDGAGFVPIGSLQTPFSGSLDGQGFTIDGLFIYRPSNNQIAIFASTHENSSISNLALRNIDITGSIATGSIVGVHKGSISKVSVTGSVTGNSHTGGLVGESYGSIDLSFSQADVLRILGPATGGLTGWAKAGSSISNSYATGSVRGSVRVGGLVGFLEGSISGSYASAAIQGDAETGGLSGAASGSASVINSYWNVRSVFQQGSPGTGLSLSAMYDRSSFENWDFDTIWDSDTSAPLSFPYLREMEPQDVPGIFVSNPVPGLIGPVDGRPFITASVTLMWENEPLVNYYHLQISETDDFENLVVDIDNLELPGYTFEFTEFGTFYWRVQGLAPGTTEPVSGWSNVYSFENSSFYAGGSGTVEDPYLIGNIYQLHNIRQYMHAHFKITRDIDASLTHTEINFPPLGFPSASFTGSLDGQGYTISNLFLNRSTTDNVGLFRIINGGTVKNLSLHNVIIFGHRQVGALAGQIRNSTISDITVSGSITSTDLTFTASIYTGGITGILAGSNATRLNSQANINGRRWCGGIAGIIGWPYGESDQGPTTVTHSRSSGTVHAAEHSAGGIAGTFRHPSSTLQDVYSTAHVSTPTSLGGILGYFSFVNSPNISRVYFAGTFPQSGAKGAFVGQTSGISGGVSEIYWDADAVAQPAHSYLATSLNTQAMRDPATFSSWDLEEAWDMYPGISRPFLRNMPIPHMNLRTTLPGPTEGWRMLYPPGEGITYGDFLSNIWTQGYPGATVPNGTPNVYRYDEPTQNWIPPASATEVISSGIIVYVFADDDFDGTPNDWPKVLAIDAIPFNAERTLSLPRTSSDTWHGWHLVGNPYPWPVQWTDLVGGELITDIVPAMYIFDPNAHDGEGGYRVHYGEEYTGDLPDPISHNGLIAPFQAFWVRSLSADAEVRFNPALRKPGQAQLFRESQHYSVVMAVEGNGSASSAMAFFNRPGTPAITEHPIELNHQPLYIGFEGDSEYPLAVTSHQLQQEDIVSLPIVFEADESGTYTISLAGLSNPDDKLELVLIDHQTGVRIDLRETREYTFEHISLAKVVEARPVPHPDSLRVPEKRQKPVVEARFELLVGRDAGILDDPGSQLPEVFALHQNYPNPFNPTTTIPFDLPLESNVVIQIFDILGNRVATLVNESRPAGSHVVTFDAARYASGVYIIRMQAGGYTSTRKMMLLK